MLTVYNRTRSRAEAFRPMGAKIAETPAKRGSYESLSYWELQAK